LVIEYLKYAMINSIWSIFNVASLQHERSWK